MKMANGEDEVTLAEGHKFDRDVEFLAYFSEVNKPSVTLEEGIPDTKSESMEYTQQLLDDAVEKVNHMEADLGGTEILEPLKKIYQTAGRPEHPRQLFIFTDGEVGNTKEVIAEVQRNSHSHRCFTFGIGEGASSALIKGISRVANGTYDFITGKDRLQPKQQAPHIPPIKPLMI